MTPTRVAGKGRERHAKGHGHQSLGLSVEYVLTACLLFMATTCEASPSIPPPFLGPIEMPMR